MIEEYVYKAGMARADIIDKTLWAILKTRRPSTYAFLIAFPYHWLWKLVGIRVETVYKTPAYEEYRVFQHNDLLATFEVKQELTTA